jgi:hypothetical protein
MTDINDQVHDEFRPRSIGSTTAPFNSKQATTAFFQDRSRLGMHEEYDPEVKNEWGGTGKFVPRQNSIMDNVRLGMGDLGHCSSNRNRDEPAKPTNGDVPCCPSPFAYGNRRLRKGD